MSRKPQKQRPIIGFVENPEKGLISTGEVAKYFGWPYEFVAARRMLGLGPKPIKIGIGYFYPFEDTAAWRALWFDRAATGQPQPEQSPDDCLYENAQWRITREGIEDKADPDYLVEASRLTETQDVWPGASLYDWPLHMARKNWVDLDAFIDAWTEALRVLAGSYEPEADDLLVRRSAAHARSERTRLYGG